MITRDRRRASSDKVRRIPARDEYRNDKRAETFQDYTHKELIKALSSQRSFTDEDIARGVLRDVISESLTSLLQESSHVRTLDTLRIIILSYERRIEERKKTIKLLKRKIRELS